MNYIIGLIILSVFLMTGCKEDVSFSQVENTGRDQEEPLGPIDPNEPGEPKESQGPVVRMIHAPSDHRVDQSTQAVFRVIKGDFEIDKVDCYVDDQSLPCDWERGVVKLQGYPLGVHRFEVVAEDVEGLTGKAKESWAIFNNYKRTRDNLKVDQGPGKTDILFVIDNSGSMKYEQTKISERFDKFIEKISGLDWHIGITTTDPRVDKAWSDGRLHAFANDDYYLTPALGERRAQELFADHVKRDERGFDTEKGIRATHRFVQRTLAPQEAVDFEMKKFLRRGASLAVVVVSDENETGNDPESEPDNMIKLVESELGKEKVFQFNSIIVHTQQCLDGQGASMGVDYEALSNKTNGIVGDICANNYSEILKDIGQGVSDLQKVHKLKCEPQDVNDDGKVDLKVTSNGSMTVPGYSLDKDRVIFDRPLDPGNYSFEYFCLVQ